MLIEHKPGRGRIHICFKLGLCFVVAALILLGSPIQLSAQQNPYDIPDPADQRTVLIANVGLTATFALVRRFIEGHIDSPSDVAETLVLGAASGYGFYQAKKRMGEQQYTLGMAMAFGSSSLSENVASGEHPLSYLRVGPGPIDVRIQTPYASTENAPVTIEVNPLSMGASIVFPLMNNNVEMRGGTLQYRSLETLGREGHRSRLGLSLGRIILLGPTSSETVRAHEMVHYIQTLQLQSVTPYPTVGSLIPAMPFQTGRFLAWDVQVKHTLAFSALITSQIPYGRRWTEIEAYTLQGEEGPQDDNHPTTSFH